jgi:hypothetical protein
MAPRHSKRYFLLNPGINSGRKAGQDVRGHRVIEIPGGGTAAVKLRAGERLKLVNTFGSQVVDTWCLAAADTSEYLSVEHTRRMLGRLFPKQGDQLFSNRRNPLLTIERDTSGCHHDMLLACCDPWLYQFYKCAPGHANCRDNFITALREHGVEGLQVPNPVNFWMNVPIEGNERIALKEPESKPGDYLILRALEDAYVVLSACPMDISPVNGGGVPKAVHLELLGDSNPAPSSTQ